MPEMSPNISAHENGRHTLPLLLVAFLVSILLSVYPLSNGVELKKRAAKTVPEQAVALVNGRQILLEEYIATVGAIEADKRGPVSAADRLLALERLIEEEILVQEGLVDGRVLADPKVRRTIVLTVLESVFAQLNVGEVSVSDLLDYCEQLSSAEFSALDQSSLASSSCAASILRGDRLLVPVYRAYSRDQLFRAYLDRLRASAHIE